MGKSKRPQQNPSPAPVPAPVAPPPAAPARHYFSRADWIAAVATFLISGGIFFYYMSPSITLQDSGELVTGAFNFGVPHPSGYPLWAFLGWIWRHLVPFGNPAWRLGLFSVVTGAALVGIMTLLMSRSILMLLRSAPWGETLEDSIRRGLAVSIGSTTALMFAFNRSVWQWACVPEMRALNAFAYGVTTCLLFAWMMRPEQHRYLYGLLLVWGLSLANHQTIIVMAFPFVVGIWIAGYLGDRTDRLRYAGLMEFGFACLVAWTVGVVANAWLLTGPGESLWSKEIKTVLLFGPRSQPLPVILLAGGSAAALLWIGVQQRMMNGKRAAICAALFVAGLAMYIYMPVAASTNPPMNWGYAYTKQGFLHSITRGQYEQLKLSLPWTEKFWTQMWLFWEQLLNQYGWILGVFAIVPVVLLLGNWARLKPRARQWLIVALTAFLVTCIGLIIIINPDIDKQNQEINLKFFVGAHGFFAMLIGYGMALTIAWGLTRWPQISRRGVVAGSWILLACAAIPFTVNWEKCEQRNHDFGHQFGYRMFYPGGGYPPMERGAVLYGGTDPGRFVPTYMIFCESRVDPEDRYRNKHFDPEGGQNFDRRDVYIITQNALADSTYMSYIRDHYDYTRPDPNNPATLERREPWQRAVFRWAWRRMHRDTMYPKEPIWIPTEQDTQRAFQEYVAGFQNRQPGPDEQVEINNGQVQVKGVGGVMAINAILTKWIFDRAKDKHAFYVEESYVIPWMYPYLTPAGIIMKINRDELPGPDQNPALWAQIVAMDRAYWDKLFAELTARPEFARDTDAQKTFSKLRSAIGGVYAYRRLLAEAEYAFQQARALCPDSPEANFRLAQLYLEQNRTDDAIRVLNELQERDPLNSKIATSIQQIGALKQGREEVQQLEPAYAANPRDVQLLIRLAQSYLKAGLPERVGSLCEHFLAQPDLSAGDIMQITQVYLSLRQMDRALASLQLLLSRYPQESQAYYGIAIIRTAQGAGTEGLEALARAIQLNPALRDQARNDTRFNNLRGHPRFQQLTGASANPFSLQ